MAHGTNHFGHSARTLTGRTYNNNAETEGSHSQADKLHLPSEPQAQYRTEWVDRGETQEMEEGHVQADNENHNVHSP